MALDSIPTLDPNDGVDPVRTLANRSVPNTRPIEKQTVAAAAVQEVAQDDAAIVKQYRVKAVLSDSLSCKEFDGFNEFGPTILIAKAFQLRQTPFDGKTVGDFAYEYETSVRRTRISTDPVCKITEEVQPPYNLDVDIIYAIEVSNTGVDATSAVDLNADGRTWASDDFVRTVKITSIFNDYLETVDINDADITFRVAKPFELRETPFIGFAVEGITYSSVNPQTRVANQVVGSDTLDETIIPKYTADFTLIQIRLVKEGTGVEVSGEEIVYIDMNVGARAWAGELPEEE